MKDIMYANSIGINILEELDKKNKVHSIFNNGINIKGKNRLIFIGTDDNGVLPFGIHLKRKDISKIIDLEVGDVFMFDKEYKKLISKDKEIDLNKAHRHTVSLPKDRNLIKKDSLKTFFNQVLDMNLETGLDIKINDILSGKEPVLKDIENIINSKDKEYIESKLRKIIGRGKGLTPSGDDILIGLIWLNDIREILSKEFLDTINDLVRNEELTTDVSINYYKAALEDKYGGLLINLCNSLIDGSRDNIKYNISTMTKLGHSSGIDTLAGIVLGLNTILN